MGSKAAHKFTNANHPLPQCRKGSGLADIETIEEREVAKTSNGLQRQVVLDLKTIEQSTTAASLVNSRE